MLEDTKDYASELEISTGAAPVLPIETGFIAPAKPEPAPVDMFELTRATSKNGGAIIGWDRRPKPGYAVTEIRYRGLIEIPAGTVVHANGKEVRLQRDTAVWLSVKPYAQPRRGRAFKAARGKGG